MKYTTVNVQQLTNRKGKPWQARAKYKDVYGKWKEVSKMLPEAKGKKEAMRIAKEWLDQLNAEADLMPNAGKAKTVDEIYKEYLLHQVSTGEIERSTYSNTLYSYSKYIKPYLGDYVFATVDKTVLSGWLTKLYQAGYSQNTIHTTYARLKKVYNYYYNNGELLKDPFKGVSLALMMGHASRAMTLDTYGDANADALTLASEKLKDTFNDNTEWFGLEEEQEDTEEE